MHGPRAGHESDTARSSLSDPGINTTEAYYDEGLLVGYRWYDAHNVTPAFPFGHGLSYTSFAYTNIKVSRIQ
jgi:beta-glucosidase